MAKYFIKYFLQEGKVESGDWALHNGEPKKATEPEIVAFANQTGCPKVKFFLCSRGIQIGDTAKILAGRQLHDSPVTCGEDVEAFKSGDLNIYNVIGEISPDAIWVKEGDELDLGDWRYVLKGRYGTADMWFDSSLYKTGEKVDFIQIKGPCGHFH